VNNDKVEWELKNESFKLFFLATNEFFVGWKMTMLSTSSHKIQHTHFQPYKDDDDDEDGGDDDDLQDCQQTLSTSFFASFRCQKFCSNFFIVKKKMKNCCHLLTTAITRQFQRKYFTCVVLLRVL
jgi:hypothetical protein